VLDESNLSVFRNKVALMRNSPRMIALWQKSCCITLSLGETLKDNDLRFERGGNRAAAGRQRDKCSLNVVEDEYHAVFECPFYNSLRDDKRTTDSP
jgi:hypothetical protein